MRALLLTLVLGVTACGARAPISPTPPHEPQHPGAVFGHVSRAAPRGFFLDEAYVPDVPFGDVHVSATSPVLAGPRETTTDTNGRFRFMDLPAGAYALTFRDPTGRVVQRRGIQVRRTRAVAVFITVQEREQIAPVCVYFQTCWH